MQCRYFRYDKFLVTSGIYVITEIKSLNNRPFHVHSNDKRFCLDYDVFISLEFFYTLDANKQFLTGKI